MFGRDGADGPDYILNRTRAEIPERLEDGVPPHNMDAPALMIYGPMAGAIAVEEPAVDAVVTDTDWNNTDPDVITILDAVLADYNADPARVYLSGVSMGGFGTWYYASHYPEKSAALLPVVGYPTIAEAKAVGAAGIPVWIFSGGRDPVVPTPNFFAGMNAIEAMGVPIRFTTEQDMFHDTWNRVYARGDVYEWLLQYTKE